MSYSGGYKSGPPRGRGFMSRGSRGSTSSGGWRGNNRGGYSPPRTSRGRGGWHRDPPSSSSYEHGRSSSRYSDMNEERFSSRSRDEGSFRRYSRQDSPAYMESHHRSPERKRMRSSDHFGQSHHRSHDSSSYDMSPRYSSSSGGGYEDKGYDRYREDRRSYRDHHSGGGGDRYPPPRDDYMHHRKEKDMDHHRHESMGRSSMPPPPPPMNPRHSASPRRSSFRGRGGLERGTRSRGRSSILRGSRGIRATLALRKVDAVASIRRKNLVDTSYVIKKKILATARSQELQKKIRMQKIRRIKESQENAEKKETVDEKEKENWDEDETKLSKEEEEVKDDQDEEQEESGTEPVETTKSEEGEKKPEDKENKKDSDEVKESDAKKEPSETSQGSGKQSKKRTVDSREVSDEGGNSKSPLGRRFIRLQCPHCHERCITFKQYTTHLYSTRHLNAMSRLHVRHKQSIIRMRQQQRKQQREEEEIDAESLTKFSSFCPVCKLNYRQTRLKHTASKMHQEMKKLLFPYCKVCGIPFKATLVYDKHMCSLEHIRREAYMEERLKQLEGRTRGKRDHDANDEQEADMDGFMIVDSVGDVDDAEDVQTDKVDDKINMDTIVGVEFVKKVEAQYCDLCQRYLPRLDDQERAQAVHCRSSQHLRLFRETQRKLKIEPEEEEEEEMEGEEKPAQEPEQNGKEVEPQVEGEGNEEGNPNQVSPEVEEAAEADEEEEEEEMDADNAHEEDPEGDAKLWARVDSDLGELLRDAEPEEEERGKSSDDDESVADDGRYDRFRNSEKKKQASKLATNGGEPVLATEEKQ